MVCGMKMAFTVYSHMFHVHCARALYNVVYLFLVTDDNHDEVNKSNQKFLIIGMNHEGDLKKHVVVTG